LSEGIFLATAQIATIVQHPLVCCIVPLLLHSFCL
jgi:hypothetical protein